MKVKTLIEKLKKFKPSDDVCAISEFRDDISYTEDIKVKKCEYGDTPELVVTDDSHILIRREHAHAIKMALIYVLDKRTSLPSPPECECCGSRHGNDECDYCGDFDRLESDIEDIAEALRRIKF